VLQLFYNEVAKEQHPVGLYEAIRNNYGALDKAATYQKYAEEIFKNTMLLDDNKWNEFVRNPDANLLQQDVAYNVANSFLRNYQGKYVPIFQQFSTRNNDWGRLYLKGVMEMNPGKVMYPDATFTMRVSYGKVADYKPRDAVRYDYVTTMSGMLGIIPTAPILEARYQHNNAVLINARNFASSPKESEFEILLKNVTGPGVYLLNDEGGNGNYAYYVERRLVPYGEWRTDAQHTGQVTITVADSINHIISGRFEFVAGSLNIYGSSPVAVTEGRFDIKVN